MRPIAVEAPSEKSIQAEVVKALKDLGYTVHSTSIAIRGKHRGWGKIGGVSPGVPDLLVGRQGWGPVRLALEMKGPKTALNDEQKDLHQRGLIVVARSLDDALAAVSRFQDRLGLAGPKFTVRDDQTGGK